MESQKIQIPSVEQIKEEWEGFAEAYSTCIENHTLKGGKKFFNSLLKRRQASNLNEQDLNLCEIACGSGEFMEHVITTACNQFKEIDMFDLATAMTVKAEKKMKELAGDFHLVFNGSILLIHLRFLYSSISYI